MFQKIFNLFAKAKKETPKDTPREAAPIGVDYPKYGKNSNERNPILQGPAGVEKYDCMRKQDDTAKSIISVIATPIKGATWNMRTEGKSKQDEEISKFLYSYFWEKGNAVFSEFLNSVLTMLPFGFAVFEKVWKTIPYAGRNFLVMELQFRPQITITEIDIKKQIVKQSVKGEDYEIPFENLIFFVLDKEGSDYWGNSVLRTCVRAFEMKNQQYQFIEDATSRLATGLTCLRLPPRIKKGSAEYEACETIVDLARHSILQGCMFPDDVKLEFIKYEADTAPFINTINNLDISMRNAALANFIGLGTTGTGSYSVGEVQFKLFMEAEKSITNLIEQIFTKEVLRPIVEVNFGPQEFYPELVCQDINKDAVIQKLNLALQFFQSGVLTATKKDEQDIRAKIGLNENLDDSHKEESKPKKEIQNLKKNNSTWKKEIDSFVQEMYLAMSGNLSMLADKAIADVRRILLKKGLKGLGDLEISTSLYQKILTKKLSFLAIRGWNEAKEYAESKGVITKAAKQEEPELEDGELSKVPAPMRDYVSNKAKIIANDHVTQLATVIKTNANNYSEGISIDNIIADVQNQVNDFLTSNKIQTAADSAVIQTMNDSEQGYYKSECADEIAYFFYEAVIDDKTTEYCRWLHHKTYTAYGREFYIVYPPRHYRCRSRMIPVFKRQNLPAPDPANHDLIPPPSILKFQQF